MCLQAEASRCRCKDSESQHGDPCHDQGSLLCPCLPSPLCPGRLTHRIVAEELTVAAVTELPIAGVGGGRGAGAALRAAILFLAQTLIGLTGQATVCKFVPLAPRVPAVSAREWLRARWWEERPTTVPAAVPAAGVAAPREWWRHLQKWHAGGGQMRALTWPWGVGGSGSSHRAL